MRSLPFSAKCPAPKAAAPPSDSASENVEKESGLASPSRRMGVESLLGVLVLIHAVSVRGVVPAGRNHRGSFPRNTSARPVERRAEPEMPGVQDTPAGSVAVNPWMESPIFEPCPSFSFHQATSHHAGSGAGMDLRP